MIKVDSLLYKIDQRLNKLATNDHQQIPLEDKILALNEAQIKLIKQKVSGFSTTPTVGLDSFLKRYEDLQILIVDYTPFPTVNMADALNRYKVDLKPLEPKYMLYIDSYVLANKGRCKKRVINVNQDLTPHADVTMLLNNAHYKPSFEYQETFNTISSDEMFIFTDGTFTLDNCMLSYLRYPVYIDKAGYVNFDGTSSIDTDCELELFLEDELLDLTVQNLSMYTENQSGMAYSQQRIQTNE